MSGAMLKTAVYGMLRVSFDLLEITDWWWGGVVLVFGLLSAIMGVIYALMQNDLKRLLAYSSVENVGIIFVCIGLAMIFTSFQMGLGIWTLTGLEIEQDWFELSVAVKVTL